MYAIMYKAKEKPLDHTVQRRAHSSAEFQNINHTGLPDQLKRGVENLSGYNMKAVRVHFRSSEPAQSEASVGSSSQITPFQFKRSGISGNNFHTIQCKRAVLGRRMEPYKDDINTFVSLPPAQQRKYLHKLILGTASGYRKDFHHNERVKRQDEVAYVDREQDSAYKSSVNAWIKEKIFVKARATTEYEQATTKYRQRVLDMDKWNIVKNRTWIKEGKADEYDSNSGINDNDKKYGMTYNGQFRLVGVDALLSNANVFEGGSGGKYKDHKDRTVTFYKLKTSSFEDYKWDYKRSYKRGYKTDHFSCPQSEMYKSAFEGNIPNSNFIAQVVNHASNVSLLCGNNIPKSVRNAEFRCIKNGRYGGGLKIFQIRNLVFPTVLAQEMEQLQEGEYEFAQVGSSDGKSKVISLPRPVAERVRREATQREVARREAARREAAQREAAQREATQGGVVVGEAAQEQAVQGEVTSTVASPYPDSALEEQQ